jgi:hypothetical protein
MPDTIENIADRMPQLEADFIADADYFRIKARLCFRLARAADDDKAARTLLSLGEMFEAKARSVRDGD